MKRKSPVPPKSEIFRVLFPPKLTKSQRTQLLIAEGVVQSCCQVGIEDTNFESVAQQVGLSRSIVNRYFPTKMEMISFTARYVRSNFQEFVVSQIGEARRAQEMLSAYVRGTLTWPQKFSQHATFWMLVFHYCGFRKEFRRFNTEVVEMGQARIRRIVEAGVASGEFAPIGVKDVSRVVHLYLTGAVLSLITEDVDRVDLFARRVEANVLKIVGWNQLKD